MSYSSTGPGFRGGGEPLWSSLSASIIPSADNTYNLGSVAKAYSDIYANALRDSDNDIRLSFANNATTIILGNLTTSGTAVGVKVANSNDLTTAGDQICGFYTGNGATTQKAAITKDGVFNPAFTDDSANTGSRTVNKPAGINAFAAGTAAITITNSVVKATSLVVAFLQTADGTLTFIKSVVPGAGSFVITGNANATGTTKVGWVVFNGV